MTRAIFTDLSPNAQADDIRLAVKLLLRPWLWQTGDGNAQLTIELRNLLGVKHLFLANSGRTCLEAILKNLDLKPGSEVLLQAYTCVAVPGPVLWAGLKPIYIDIEPDTLNLSLNDLQKKLTPQSKVLIIQHTFGRPADLDRILLYARQHNLFVIEDCAHALGTQYRGRPVGTFGDAGFYSFGRDKVISSVFGGALTVKNEGLGSRLQAHFSGLQLPKKNWVVQQIAHPILTKLVKMAYATNHVSKFLLFSIKKLHLISLAVQPEEKNGERAKFIGRRLPNALTEMARHQLKKIRKINLHRQKLAAYYRKELSHLPLRHLKRSEDDISLRYTILTKHADALRTAAANNNIYLGNWYSAPVAPAGVNYQKIHYHFGSCPVAEKCANESLNLPTHIEILPAVAQKIVNFIKNWYAHYSA